MLLVNVEHNQEYWEFIRKLRTDPDTIMWFRNQNDITPEEQQRYMELYHKDYYVCLLNKDMEPPIGFIGIMGNDIRYAVIPSMRGLGIGKFMLKEIKKMYPNAIAKVKQNNIASISALKSVGIFYRITGD